MSKRENKGKGSGVWELYEDVARNKHKKKSFDNRYVSLTVSSMEEGDIGPKKQPEVIHIEEMAANIVVRTKIISEMHEELRRTTQTTFQSFHKKKQPKAKKPQATQSKPLMKPENPKDFEIVFKQLEVLDSEEDGALEKYLNNAFEESGILSSLGSHDSPAPEISLQFNQHLQSQSQTDLRGLLDTMDNSLFAEKFDLPKITKPESFTKAHMDHLKEILSRVPKRTNEKDDFDKYMIKPEGSPEIKGYMYPETSSDEEMDDSISEDEGDEATSDGEKEIDRPSVQEDLVEKISEHRIKNTKKENPKNCNEEEQIIFSPQKRSQSKYSQMMELAPCKLRKPEQLQFSKEKGTNQKYPHKLAKPIFGDLVQINRKGIEIDYTRFLSFSEKKITDHCLVYVDSRTDFEDCLATSNSTVEIEDEPEEDEDDLDHQDLLANSEKKFFEKIENEILSPKKEASPLLSSPKTPRSEKLASRVYSPIGFQTPKRTKKKGIYDICCQFFNILNTTNSISIREFTDIQDPQAFVAMIHLAHSINTENKKILPLLEKVGEKKFSVVVQESEDFDNLVIEKKK